MPKFNAALIACLMMTFSVDPLLAAHDVRQWQIFKSRFVSPEGRVVDKQNGDISHSEGQGFGLLFAALFQDREAFQRIWQWTQKNLQIRKDALLAWKWVPRTAEHVPDRNNAADGDIFTTWALALAGETFHNPAWNADASRIARDIRRELVSRNGARTILLPGSDGFTSDKGTLINFSYWVFQAFRALNSLDPSSDWADLEKSGLALIDEAQFGRWKLPPDWVTITPQGKLLLPTDRPQRFSYDAVRIPLHLVWAGLGTPSRLRRFLAFWDEFDKVPFVGAWTNLSDDSIAAYGPPKGFRAIRGLVTTSVAKVPYTALEFASQDDYYSSALVMLANLAADGLPKR